MSRVPIGSSSSKKLGFGVPIPKSYFSRYEFTSQFEGAERVAERWGVTRGGHGRFWTAFPAAGGPGLGRRPLRQPDHPRGRAGA